MYHRLLIAACIFIEQVGFIKYQDNRHAISLGRSQETIDKGSGCLRINHRNHQNGLIDISRQDMTLFREIDTLTDNVITAILDLGNKSRTLVVRYNLYPIAHGYRVSTTDTFQSKVTLYLTLNQLAIVG